MAVATRSADFFELIEVITVGRLRPSVGSHHHHQQQQHLGYVGIVVLGDLRSFSERKQLVQGIACYLVPGSSLQVMSLPPGEPTHPMRTVGGKLETDLVSE